MNNNGSYVIDSLMPMDGGYSLGNNLYLIDSNGEAKMFKVNLGTGTVWTMTFLVNARNEQDAVDKVADFAEDNELNSCISTYDELEELCDEGQSVDDYAEGCGMTNAGNHGLFICLIGLEEI